MRLLIACIVVGFCSATVLAEGDDASVYLTIADVAPAVEHNFYAVGTGATDFYGVYQAPDFPTGKGTFQDGPGFDDAYQYGIYFIGLYGNTSSGTFSPQGVTYLCTASTAANIIANQEDFSQVFTYDDGTGYGDDAIVGLSEQQFIADAMSGSLSDNDINAWTSAEESGGFVYTNTPAALVNFSIGTDGGTAAVSDAPLPEPVSCLIGIGVAIWLGRRRSR